MQKHTMGVPVPSLPVSSKRTEKRARHASAAQAREPSASDGPASTLSILGAITLGIPGLLLIPLIGMNPSIQAGTLAALAMLLISSAFLVAMVFEIKRIADKPSGADPG
ncbi:hypothetical protein [Microvirga makkahensis]|uniref:Uncharacterized protein n=1 Tax=Microvirga makkahensis TaxID=1128670 RepID=A0A7X3SRE6_9HYPH|nr:hypothetical protein [Microvirga makkahensis]MXQ14541.1 hypothetical protein [Microvirga makkahensis]